MIRLEPYVLKEHEIVIRAQYHFKMLLLFLLLFFLTILSAFFVPTLSPFDHIALLMFHRVLVECNL